MTLLKEFSSNFIKIGRTPILALHLLTPVAVTALFLLYYTYSGYRIIHDPRLFFIVLEIGYPMFVGVAVPLFIHLDRDIGSIHNALGIVASRTGVYLGKLLFLLFLSALGVILYELCFYIGSAWLLGAAAVDFGSCIRIFCVLMLGSVFLYALHITAAFRFGSSLSVLLGIGGSIMAGMFENAIGDAVWPFIPWEWGIRLLKYEFGHADELVSCGVFSLVILTSLILILSLLWFNRWEGKTLQE